MQQRLNLTHSCNRSHNHPLLHQACKAAVAAAVAVDTAAVPYRQTQQGSCSSPSDHNTKAWSHTVEVDSHTAAVAARQKYHN